MCAQPLILFYVLSIHKSITTYYLLFRLFHNTHISNYFDKIDSLKPPALVKTSKSDNFHLWWIKKPRLLKKRLLKNDISFMYLFLSRPSNVFLKLFPFSCYPLQNQVLRLERWKCNFPPCLFKEIMTDRPIEKPTNRRTWGFVGKLHNQ